MTFTVTRHIRPKKRCSSCSSIVQAAAPPRPIEKGFAGASLLALILSWKYAFHLPLYRQCQIFAHAGLKISRTTLMQWVGASSELLGPLAGALAKHVLTAPNINADDTPIKVLAGSTFATAFNYAFNNWDALQRYTEDGHLEIDNNIAECSLRGVGVGTKNYLFFGSDTGGDRAAIIYSLIETCKLNRIDPQRYLHYVLERIADHPINRIEELLPWKSDRSTAAACASDACVGCLSQRWTNRHQKAPPRRTATSSTSRRSSIQLAAKSPSVKSRRSDALPWPPSGKRRSGSGLR